MRKNKSLIIFLLFLLTFLITAGAVGISSFTPEVIRELRQQGLVASTLEANRGLSFAFVTLAGLMDGLNICSIHLILLLIGYLLLLVKNKKRSLEIGIIFILTIFTTYFIFGAAVSATLSNLMKFSQFQLVEKIVLYVFAAILALAGLLNIKDSLFSRSTFDLGAWEEKLIVKKLAHLHVIGTVVVAFISTLFLLPCSLPLYLGSISILHQTFSETQMLFYILVYSLMFVLPLVLVIAVLMRAEQFLKVEDLQADKFRKVRFLHGLAQLVIASLLIII